MLRIFCSVFFGWLFVVPAAAIELQWKTSEPVRLTVKDGASLPEILRGLLQEHAVAAEKVRLAPNLSQDIAAVEREASSAEALFQFLLREHQLTLLAAEDHWEVVADREVWRRRPYQRWVESPLALQEVLQELSQWGKIPLQWAPDAPIRLQLVESLQFDSVEQAFQNLAAQAGARVVYDAERHQLRWERAVPEITQSLTFQNATAAAIAQFLPEVPNEVTAAVTLSFPAQRIAVLQGPVDAVEQLQTLLRQFDATWEPPQAPPAEALPQVETQVVRLQHLPRELAAQLVETTQRELPETQAVQVRYVGEQLVLQGQAEAVALLETLLVQADVAPVHQEEEGPQALMPPQSESSLKPARVISVVLDALPDTQIAAQLEQLERGGVRLDNVSVSWNRGTRPAVLWLQGRADEVELVRETFTQLESRWLQQQLSQRTTPRTTMMERFRLRHLQVGEQRFVSAGQDVTLPGAEQQLREYFLQNAAGVPDEDLPHILPDPRNNALLVQASAKQLRQIQALLDVWDQPSPLIRIEAHIFETTEESSRELGMRWRARSLSTAGVVSAEVPDFSVGLVGGPQETTYALRIDAVLRLLQERGQGRVLSRPVVVTMNNMEAEMNSGSILNVRLINDTTTQLRELQTGVTLRVTPRWIPSQTKQEAEGLIRLRIFAETSTPLSEDAIDGIPTLNTQRAQSHVDVPNGQPFLLGGMIRQRDGESRAGIPWLQELPLLGYLFSSSNVEQRFDHVLVFVTPTRITPDLATQPPALQDLSSENATNLLNTPAGSP